MQPVRNFCIVEVKSGYNELASSIELQDGEAARLPDPSAEGSFNLVWFNYTDYKNPADDPHREIIKVTSVTGNILTVQRGQEGISATPKNTPGRIYKMMLSLTRAAFEELVNGRHGVVTGNTFGNERGTNATDFQFLRSSDTQVASGVNSFIAAGMNNTASGESSFSSGCGNMSSGQYSHSEGRLNTSSSTASHAEGYFCSAGGVASHAEGYQTSALGNNSHAEGFQTSAVGVNSHAEGNGAIARLRGEHAQASGYISEFGDAQFSSVTLSGVTHDGNPTELVLSPPSERIVLEDNLSAGFYARITAHSSGNAAEAAYIEFKGLVSRIAGPSSVTLSACIKTVIWKAVPSWDAIFEADSVNGALKVKVTGETGKTVRWLVILEMAKIR